MMRYNENWEWFHEAFNQTERRDLIVHSFMDQVSWRDWVYRRACSRASRPSSGVMKMPAGLAPASAPKQMQVQGAQTFGPARTPPPLPPPPPRARRSPR